jgi:hypothetical protein
MAFLFIKDYTPTMKKSSIGYTEPIQRTDIIAIMLVPNGENLR